MTQHRLPLDDDDSIQLEVALGMEAAAFRARHALGEHRRGTPVHRSDRAYRVGRAYLDAIHALLREAPRKGRDQGTTGGSR